MLSLLRTPRIELALPSPAVFGEPNAATGNAEYHTSPAVKTSGLRAFADGGQLRSVVKRLGPPCLIRGSGNMLPVCLRRHPYALNRKQPVSSPHRLVLDWWGVEA